MDIPGRLRTPRWLMHDGDTCWLPQCVLTQTYCKWLNSLFFLPVAPPTWCGIHKDNRCSGRLWWRLKLGEVLEQMLSGIEFFLLWWIPGGVSGYLLLTSLTVLRKGQRPGRGVVESLLSFSNKHCEHVLWNVIYLASNEWGQHFLNMAPEVPQTKEGGPWPGSFGESWDSKLSLISHIFKRRF
jgi:hypothetical protein